MILLECGKSARVLKHTTVNSRVWEASKKVSVVAFAGKKPRPRMIFSAQACRLI